MAPLLVSQTGDEEMDALRLSYPSISMLTSKPRIKQPSRRRCSTICIGDVVLTLGKQTLESSWVICNLLKLLDWNMNQSGRIGWIFTKKPAQMKVLLEHVLTLEIPGIHDGEKNKVRISDK